MNLETGVKGLCTVLRPDTYVVNVTEGYCFKRSLTAVVYLWVSILTNPEPIGTITNISGRELLLPLSLGDLPPKPPRRVGVLVVRPCSRYPELEVL